MTGVWTEKQQAWNPHKEVQQQFSALCEPLNIYPFKTDNRDGVITPQLSQFTIPVNNIYYLSPNDRD